ncbi:MAG TPA: methyltransferase domain-containing protein [Terriglobales bacterium]|nr:methyltransferase domain-containing protein [Terriglobales bacterium]
MSDPPALREWDSEAYHRLSRPQFDWGMKVLNRLRLRGDETVLDAGCGTGKLTAELLTRLPKGRVVALDLSHNMLRLAGDHLAPQFPLQVSLVEADVQALPFAEVFDGVLSTATFHWATDHERLFRSLHRALKPSGWLLAQCGGGPNLAAVRERARTIASCPEFREFFAGWTEPWVYADDATTAQRLRRAGFVEVEANLEHSPAVLSDAEEYKEYLATVTLHPHMARITDDRLRGRFLEELARRGAQDDPPFVMDYWRLNVSARRPA